MHHKIFGIAAAVICFGTAQLAHATDILSSDQDPHVVTVTTDAGTQTFDLPAMGEIRDICNGCELSLEDGQTITAKADDILSVIEGELLPDE